MKKRLISLLLTGAVMSSFATAAYTEDILTTDDIPTIIINGVKIETEYPSYMEGNEVMVHLPSIAKIMGYSISESPPYSNQYINVFKENSGWGNLRITFNSEGNRVDMSFSRIGYSGRTIRYTTPPVRIDGQVYVPFSSFADAFDYIVKWERETHTATLILKKDFPIYFQEELTTDDAIIILRNVAGIEGISKEQRAKYDFNNDGNIGTQNALFALKTVVGLEKMSVVQEQMRQRVKAFIMKDFNDRIEGYLLHDFVPYLKVMEENKEIVSSQFSHEGLMFFDSNSKIFNTIRSTDEKHLIKKDDVYYISSKTLVEMLRIAMKNKQATYAA